MQDQRSTHQCRSISSLLPPDASPVPAPHPQPQASPVLCRMGPTGSGLSNQDQQQEGPGPIPGISHCCP